MSSATPPARRNVALVVVDIVVSLLALFFAFGLGLVSTAFVMQLFSVGSECGAASTCNATAIGIATYGLLAVTVLGFFLGVGFFIVRLIQKRYTFPWAVGALVVMLVAFYVASWIAGGAVAAA